MVSEPETAKDIADRLMSALQQDEFVLYTQSIVPLVPQRDDQAFQEIFVRFKEEDAKLLPPGTFFPLIEECRLLTYLDRWVVNRLARFVRSGLKFLPDWKIPRYNVNLSDETLADPKFGDYVLKYVDLALRRFVHSGKQKKLLDLQGCGGVRKSYDYKQARSGG